MNSGVFAFKLTQNKMKLSASQLVTTPIFFWDLRVVCTLLMSRCSLSPWTREWPGIHGLSIQPGLVKATTLNSFLVGLFYFFFGRSFLILTSGSNYHWTLVFSFILLFLTFLKFCGLNAINKGFLYTQFQHHIYLQYTPPSSMNPMNSIFLSC